MWKERNRECTAHSWKGARAKVHKSSARSFNVKRNGSALIEEIWRIANKAQGCEHVCVQGGASGCNVVNDDRTLAEKPLRFQAIRQSRTTRASSDPIYQHRRSYRNPGCSISGDRHHWNDAAVSTGSTRCARRDGTRLSSAKRERSFGERRRENNLTA